MLAILAVASACTASSEEVNGDEPEPVQLLAPDEFAAYIDNNPDTPLINVHIPYQGHITGTDSFVSFDQILNWDQLPTELDEPIILYCRSGNMSGQSAEALADAGYTNIIDLDGGMNAWQETGRTLEASEPSDNN